jgi:ABC-2 type transport system permease protein
MSDARIHQLGYRSYEGPRLGVGSAVMSTARHAFRSLLGVRRGVFAKLVTLATALLAYLPAVVFAGLAVLIPQQLIEMGGLPGPSDYLGFTITALVLFVSLGSPVVLCPDRRHGTIALYLASPLNRDTYLLGRALAVFAFLAIVTIGPTLLLLFALEMVGEGSGVMTLLGDAGRAVAAGTVLGIVFTTVSLAISSVTDRQASAAAFTILFLFGSLVISGILIEGLEVTPTVGLANVVFVGLEAALRWHGETGPLEHLPTWQVAAAWLAWVGGTSALLRWRYRHVEVTR